MEINKLRFTDPAIDSYPPPGSKPLIDDFSLALYPGDRCLFVGSNGAGTILKIIGGKHIVEPDMVRVLGRFQVLICHVECTRHLMVKGEDFKFVLLLDEITVDLDVLVRADLMWFLREECELRGATIIYTADIFEGLDHWPTHFVYIAHGRLQLAVPMDKVKEMCNMSLMRPVESWLSKEGDEERKRRKERKANGLPEFEKHIEGTSVTGDPARATVRALNYGWAGGSLHSTVAGEENFVLFIQGS